MKYSGYTRTNYEDVIRLIHHSRELGSSKIFSPDIYNEYMNCIFAIRRRLSKRDLTQVEVLKIMEVAYGYELLIDFYSIDEFYSHYPLIFKYAYYKQS